MILYTAFQYDQIIKVRTDIFEDNHLEGFHPGFQPSSGHSHLQDGGGVGIPFGGGVVGIMGDGGEVGAGGAF